MNASITSTQYDIRNVLVVPPDAVQEYWQLQYMHDRLKHRLCDIVNPSWTDVLDMICRMGKHMYMIFHQDVAVCEFMLENFTGRSAQIHFSMRPGLKASDSFKIARFGVDSLLVNYLESLYGLIPVPNRASKIHCLRSGFTCLGILPSGLSYQGKIVDAYIMVRGGTHG